MAQGKRNPEKTRRDILNAAGEVLAEKGLSGFHVHDIAEKAGYGKPLVYRYFGDKRAVLDALAVLKAREAGENLSKLTQPEGSDISPHVYRQVMFARHLAGDQVLRGLFRAQLVGAIGGNAARALEGLIPVSGKKGDAAAAEAFLLAGISYLLLLRESQKTCAGVAIETATDLAAFERAFVKLSCAV